ncbi:hypothetical protein GLE_0806 [Lysobacter enzymogenes]|uniref:Uncharacterized protein n=1 Tax=Lysobacter enzymogenes TaxID=69 RepID=A0A0S2DCC0_LYSEN|nr:hypothetical protein GLE_0806 [Lysobacter enzymogenes]
MRAIARESLGDAARERLQTRPKAPLSLASSRARPPSPDPPLSVQRDGAQES